MRIHVDMNRCESHGQCVFAAPGHFSFDEDDNLLVQPDVPGDEAARNAVREAASACPVQAISLHGGEAVA